MRDWAALDKKYIWHPFTQMEEWLGSELLVIDSAEGNYVVDTNDNRYLDGISSLWVNIHGHRKKKIDDAIKRQLDKVAHSTLLGLASTSSIELAEKLVGITPRNLTKVFYSDSGSTAVEVGLKIAFQYWRNVGFDEKRFFLTLSDAYHGDTIGSVSLGGIDLFHSIFHPLLFNTLTIPAPFPYRYPNLTPEQCKEMSLDHLKKIVNERGHEIAAMVMEPLVQGAAGMIVHPEGYLREVANICRSNCILLVCDEVATGFGRTGKMFAVEHENVEPDILCLAKGLSGGYLPLAATLVSDKIFEAFLGKYTDYKTFFHGHSYTGNALACAAACAALDIFEEERVMESLPQKIECLRKELASQIAPLPWVADVRQCGFMVGIEIAEHVAARKAFPVEFRIGHQIILDVRKAGVILRPLGDVLVLMPPLSITEDEIRYLVGAAAQSIRNVCSNPKPFSL